MRIIPIACILSGVILMAACHSSNPPHPASMSDPAAYNAHFGNLDRNGDDRVTREEFRAYFPQADETAFDLVDADGDDHIGHAEWHRFKEAHGLEHH
ncbi:MAG: hypothetical protein PVJ53_06295 [Desulfobacterales bacterium]